MKAYTVYQISGVIDAENKPSEVYLFCKANGIECGYDWNNTIGKWTEVYLDGELVFQFDYDTTKEQFIEYVQKQSKSFQYTGEIDLSGDDIWIACEDEELFNQFVKTYHEIFL